MVQLKRPQIKKIRFTKEGYEKLQKEYDELLAQRPDAVMHLKRAREMGDLSENGYYKASRAKLSSIDGRLFRLKMQLRHAAIVSDEGSDSIGIGSTVTFTDGKKEMMYHIVGDLEANPSEGKLSLLSPLGRAFEGKKAGEEVSIEIPAGKMTYKILSIS